MSLMLKSVPFVCVPSIPREINIIKMIFFYVLLMVFSMNTPLYAEDFNPSRAVVKIFVASNPKDYYQPWQSRGLNNSSGSGFVIEGNKIITNAHVIDDHTFVQVKKENDPKKYTAKVDAVGEDCDLALLSIEDPSFFEGITPLNLGDLPRLKDAVVVLGYPLGGGKLSITEGVVSRIEVTAYSHSARQLLAVQIDAAINPGNSGGPVLKDKKVVGVAMQLFQNSQNIGYMIPVPIIQHFFDDLTDGHYDGFPIIGIDFNNTENPTLREFYKINLEQGGVLITKVLPFSSADNILREGDVILKINNVPIGEDGTFQFRDDERLLMPHLITMEQIGQMVSMEIVRDAKKKIIPITFKEFSPLVPYPDYFLSPPYYILGGLVFTVLSTDLLRSWGPNWWERAPIDFNYNLVGSGRLNDKRKKDVVVLLNVLPDDINIGYHSYINEVIARLNGNEFSSFKEFVSLIDKIKRDNKYLIIETEHDFKIIVSTKDIDRISDEILKRNSIQAPFSDEVKLWLNLKS